MKEEKSPTDSDILALCKLPLTRNKGFELLVEKFQKNVYHQIKRMLLNHEDTRDVMQNTFIKVWNGLPGFREDAKLGTWIYRIAANETINFLNSKNKKFLFVGDSQSEYLKNNLKSSEYVDYDAFEIKFQKAILTLPDKQRQVFTMKFYEDYTFDQMAEILNQSSGGLKASYHHATKKIEKYLDEN